MQRQLTVVEDPEENVGFFELHHEQDTRTCNLEPEDFNRLRTISERPVDVEVKINIVKSASAENVEAMSGIEVEDGVSQVI
ncbi:hypothetical protein L596_021367 [Steinernema carpocapsae]|uniref:Uncharacterized protein n=1 Tax=Steinernema carpocapsae TaxID=34508 RepID=A0A4U5MIG9_STECR|nr:hypothetical protein L596_021367 [Steinernema carpocapsae]